VYFVTIVFFFFFGCLFISILLSSHLLLLPATLLLLLELREGGEKKIFIIRVCKYDMYKMKLRVMVLSHHAKVMLLQDKLSFLINLIFIKCL
jgi:hypothetical protein